MKHKDVERAIYDQFNATKPDLFQQILDQCPKMTESHRTESIWDRLRDIVSNRSIRYSFASLGAFLVVLFIIFGSSPTPVPQAYSLIAIEVNPSLTLELDENDVVIAATATNEDAIIILGDMDLVGVDSNVAINAIIGSMVIKGYITDIANSVLLSIQSNDETKEQELLSELTQMVSDLLSGSSINGSVISQTLRLSDEAHELAELLGISEAKAELILDIVDIDPRASAENLALLSINDLNLLLEAKNYALENVKHVGTASNLGIIPIDEAYQISLDYLSLNATEVIEYDIELEQEDGLLLYEINIETNTSEYELLVDAKLGTIYDESSNGDIDDEIDNDQIALILSESEMLANIANQLSLNISFMIDVEMDLEAENGIVFYDISFEYGDDEYELEVNAITAEIYSNSMDDAGYDYDDEESDD